MASSERTVIYEGDDSLSVTAWTTALSQRNDCTVRRSHDPTELSELLTLSPHAVVVVNEGALRGDLQLLDMIRRRAPEAPVLIMTSSFGLLVKEALGHGVKDVLHAEQDPTWLIVNRVLQYLPREPATDANAVERPIKTVPLPELHGESGRLSAAAIASYLGVPLKDLAEQGLGAKYGTTHKTPDSETLQPKLREFARVLELLKTYVGDASQTRAWLCRPHPDLSNTPPLQVMLLGRASTVRALLEDALNGYPS